MQVVRSLHLPSTAMMRWLDTHLTMRLSILCAFLFGKSQLAAQLVRWLGAAGAVLRTVLQPVLGFLRCLLTSGSITAVAKLPHMLCSTSVRAHSSESELQVVFGNHVTASVHLCPACNPP